jgi:hypothetical protein
MSSSQPSPMSCATRRHLKFIATCVSTQEHLKSMQLLEFVNAHSSSRTHSSPKSVKTPGRVQSPADDLTMSNRICFYSPAILSHPSDLFGHAHRLSKHTAEGNLEAHCVVSSHESPIFATAVDGVFDV